MTCWLGCSGTLVAISRQIYPRRRRATKTRGRRAKKRRTLEIDESTVYPVPAPGGGSEERLNVHGSPRIGGADAAQEPGPHPPARSAGEARHGNVRGQRCG